MKTTKPKPLGQIAYEAKSKEYGYGYLGPLKYMDLPPYYKRQWVVISNAVAREVKRRGRKGK